MKFVILGHFSFPTGSASASRIRNISSALNNLGCDVQIVAFTGYIKKNSLKYAYLYKSSQFESKLLNKFLFTLQYLFSPFVLFYKLVSLNLIFGEKRAFIIYGRNFYFLFPITCFLKILGHFIIFDLVELPIAVRKKGSFLNPLHLDEFLGVKSISKVSNLNLVITSALKTYINDPKSLIVPVNIVIEEKQNHTNKQKNDYFNILYIGMFFERDDPDALISIINGIVDEISNAKIHLVSRDSSAPSVLNSIKKLNPKHRKRIEIYNNISDDQITQLSLDADVILVTRKDTEEERNSFPTRLIESLQYNGLVVTRDMKDANLYFENDKSILFYSSNTYETVEKIKFYLHKTEKMIEIIKNAKIVLSTKFNSETYASKILKLVINNGK